MRAARESRQSLQNDEQWWTSTTEMLAQAERRLGARSAATVTVDRDRPMTSTYVQVLLLEAVIIAALWIFGRLFA